MRFRKNVKSLPGIPDIVFSGQRVAVFCDGDFWHGRRWDEQKLKLARGNNAAYWLSKIESNIQRDLRNTELLEAAGWKVIRVWETDIKRDPQVIALSIRDVVNCRKQDKNSSGTAADTPPQISREVAKK